MKALAKQLLEHIWAGLTGYTQICGIDWLNGNKFINGKFFNWPKDADALYAYANELTDKNIDIYFTPGLFDQPSRTKEHAKSMPLIWADCDEADKDKLTYTRPSALWETSPGRHQAVWVVDRNLPLADRGSINQALSYILGCDPGGWDTPQLLRLPGFMSRKREPPTMVGNLRLNSSQNLLDLVARVYATLPNSETYYRSQLSATHVAGDRSEVFYSLVAHLTSLGLEPPIIQGLLTHTVWNKWPNSELLNVDIHRIQDKLIPSKALASLQPELTTLDRDGSVSDRPRLEVRPLSSIVYQPKPRWLINDLIEHKSCGFIAGPPKQFKSWVMLDIAVSLASGKPCLGEFKPRKPQATLIVEAEDNFARLSQRLISVIVERSPESNPYGHLTYSDKILTWYPPENDLPLYLISQPPLGFGEDFYNDLVTIIQEKHIKLCVFDTLSMLTSENLNDSQSMYTTVLRPLKQVANELDSAMMLVHHTRKATVGLANSGGAALAGSVALHAWSDNSLYMQRTDEGSAILEIESKAQAAQTYNMSNLNTPGKWAPVLLKELD